MTNRVRESEDGRISEENDNYPSLGLFDNQNIHVNPKFNVNCTNLYRKVRWPSNSKRSGKSNIQTPSPTHNHLL